MNPSTAFATVFVDELARCGLREVVLAPGSRSAPLAMAFHHRSQAGDPLRLHVRIDERSAAFLALGLAKASGRPAAVLCTSGTAAANFHPAVIEADESGVPLLLLTADRPPELRGTGANQTIDQVRLYGSAVRWFADAGVPEARPGMNAYWRSLACRAWAAASGAAGGFPGPAQVNLPLRDPLVPDLPDAVLPGDWPETLAGRPGGAPWTRLGRDAGPGPPGTLELPWTEAGVVLAGDGTAGPAAVAALAGQAGWPVLAEPSSGARRGAAALTAYQYLLDDPAFTTGNLPDLVISAGRPGLSRGQLSFLRQAAAHGARHVVLAQGAGRWADPARTATDVAVQVRLGSVPPPGPPGGQPSGWLRRWQRADAAARRAVDAILGAGPELTEPRLARDLAAALPDGALLWAASSQPIRDLDRHMAPRAGLRVLASRGASGIDGLVSTASGAALAHQAVGGGPAVALLGDLAVLHDAPGLFAGPGEPRPDLVIVVASNDGGGIFSSLEPAAFPDSFERVFGTPHGAQLSALAESAGLPYLSLRQAAGLPDALRGGGLRVVEVPAGRAAGAALRRQLAEAARTALSDLS
ncbi:MAG TPA: 2-succinyl-5-enolpyruvyl-6-hydroxy-3-cyclohexene-1-carboxylic-acid synthase [Streptosporangiaceae bacterium]|nr:2-succinyl-5-enolpyruvyl-6-hydroxy-3-cyclohexene-1-carboxylic-acid synthase [Streptosporangiaceae bacterium]